MSTQERRLRVRATATAVVLGAIAVFLCPAVLGPLITSDGRLDPPSLEVALWLGSGGLLAAAISLLVAPHELSRKLLRWLALCVMVAGSTSATFVLAEFLLRFQLAQPHDEQVQSYEFSYMAHTNRAGYRDSEFDPVKQPGTLRVLAIGDSFIYGTGVADADSIPTLLERSLSEQTGRPVDVLNLGVPATDTYAYAQRAAEFVGYAPDLVLLAVYVDNDIEASPPPATIPRLVKSLRLVELAQRLSSGNAMGVCDGLPGVDPIYADLACRSQINVGLFARAAVGDNHAYYDELTERFRTRPFTRTNLLAVRDAFPAVPLLLVVIPSKYQVSTRYFDEPRKLGFVFSRDEPISDTLQQTIVAWARSESLACIDLLPALRAEPTTTHYYAIDDHFDPAGNRLTARLVTEWVAEQRVFER